MRIAEIKAIRNRVAHLREPHAQDRPRMELFLRDMEQGVRKFCRRYTVGRIPPGDPVAGELERRWPRIGYGIEMLLSHHSWLYAMPQPDNVKLHARLERLVHATHKQNWPEGIIYKLTLDGPIRGGMDALDLLKSTTALHKDVIHIMMAASGQEVAVTIPAVHGVEATAELISKFLSVAVSLVGPTQMPPCGPDVRAGWPEYVLWPDHMLTFFDDDAPGPILVLPT